MLDVMTKSSQNHPVVISPFNISEHPWHTHKDDIEIIWVLDGEVEIQVSIYDFKLKKGDVFIVNSTVMHSIKGLGRNVTLVYHFNIPYFSNYFPELGKAIFICDPQAEEKKVHVQMLNKLLGDLFMDYFYEVERKEYVLIDDSVAIISFMKNYFSSWQIHERKLIGSNPFYNNPICQERLLNAIEYLYDNFDKRISLDDIAQSEYVSKYYLSHIMKKGLGLSFQETLNLIRTEKAQKYLYSTNLKIAEISEKCGFSSPAFFRKTYRRYVGKTPSEDRKVSIPNTILNKAFQQECLLDNHTADAICALFNRSPEVSRENSIPEHSFNIISEEINLHGDKAILAKPPRMWLKISDMNELLPGTAIHILEQSPLSEICKTIVVKEDTLKTFFDTLLNWEPLYGFVELLKKQKINLIIEEGGEKNNRLWSSLSEYFEKVRLPKQQWKRCNFRRMDYFSSDIATVPSIISDIMKQKLDITCVSMFSHGKEKEAYLFYSNGLKTPVYYAYHIINRLEGQLLRADGTCLITRKKDNIRILLNNERHDVVNNYILKIKNLRRDYACSIFYFFSDSGDVKKVSEELFNQKEIDDTLKHLIEMKAFPKYTIYGIEATTEYLLHISLPKNAIVFIELN